ncbi:MAG: HTH-type transcriptional regulator BhcR [Pseudomonadota bacterium]
MNEQTKRSRGRPRGQAGGVEASTIQSLDRAIRVLQRLGTAEGLSLSELASDLEESPSTLYRVLTTLARHQMVEFQEATQLWYIGIESFRIGSAFLGRTQLVEQARIVMRHLMGDTGETANLGIGEEREVIFVSQVETHEPIRAFFRPGTRGAIHSSGIGKALLAHRDGDAVARLFEAGPLPAFTPSTITGREQLAEHLAGIRSTGWSVDNEEHTIGMRCIAAPIFNEFGEAVAGVSISGPSVRIRPDRDADLGLRVRNAADAITQAIGGRRPGP